MTELRPYERPYLGAAILFAGITCAALMDVAGKILSADISVLQVTWARFFFHAVFLAPLALLVWRGAAGEIPAGQSGKKPGKKTRWGVHILRGFLLAGASVCFFFALQNNPVPDSLAIFFVEPLIVMFLARIFLKEPFNRRLLFAAFGGMLGVLIILRPGGNYEWTILFALGAAFCFAGYIVAARFSSFNTPAPITSFLTAVFGLLPLLPVLFFWTDSTPRLWLLMAAVGLLSGVGHTLIILALRYIRASLLAVLHYAEIGIAAILSWFIFAYWPDLWVWCGIGVIIASNLYALRFGKADKKPAAAQ